MFPSKTSLRLSLVLLKGGPKVREDFLHFEINFQMDLLLNANL